MINITDGGGFESNLTIRSGCHDEREKREKRRISIFFGMLDKARGAKPYSPSRYRKVSKHLRMATALGVPKASWTFLRPPIEDFTPFTHTPLSRFGEGLEWRQRSLCSVFSLNIVTIHIRKRENEARSKFPVLAPYIDDITVRIEYYREP